MGKIIGGDGQIILPPNGGKLYNFLEATNRGTIAFVDYISATTWKPRTVFEHPFCLYNTAKHGQRAGRLLLLDILFALSNREGHFAWSLIFPPGITGVFYFWDCSTFICIGVKITIQQLYSPWFKKKFIVQCPGKADTKTVSPTVLAITMGGGWILCD